MTSELANRACIHTVSRTTDAATYAATVKDTPWDTPRIDNKPDSETFIYSFSIEEIPHEDKDDE